MADSNDLQAAIQLAIIEAGARLDQARYVADKDFAAAIQVAGINAQAIIQGGIQNVKNETDILEKQLRVQSLLAEKRGEVDVNIAEAQGDIQATLLGKRGEVDVLLAEKQGEIEQVLAEKRGEVEINVARERGAIEIDIARARAESDAQVARVAADGQISAATIRSSADESIARITSSSQSSVASSRNASDERVAALRSQTDIRTTDIQATATRYSSDNSKTASVYGADKGYESARYSVDAQDRWFDTRLEFARDRWVEVKPLIDRLGDGDVTVADIYAALMSAAGPAPSIPATGALTPSQVAEASAAIVARADQTAASRISRLQADLSGRGFAAGSPLTAMLSQSLQQAAMRASIGEVSSLQVQAAQANSELLLRYISARQQQYNANQQAYLELEKSTAQTAVGLANAIGGVISGAI
jgi:hypothetical protein